MGLDHAVDVAHGHRPADLEAAQTEDAGDIVDQRAALPNRQEPVGHRNVQLEDLGILLVSDHAAIAGCAGGIETADGTDLEGSTGLQRVEIVGMDELQKGHGGVGQLGSRQQREGRQR